MSNTATVTATYGPGLTATALVLSNVSAINFDFRAFTVQVFQDDKFETYSLTGVTTVTFSISGTTYTITIS